MTNMGIDPFHDYYIEQHDSNAAYQPTGECELVRPTQAQQYTTCDHEQQAITGDTLITKALA
jgi:hypothetical protein